MDWDEMLRFLRFAAVQTSLDRYNSWHDKFLQRRAEDRERTSGVGSIKRPRVVHEGLLPVSGIVHHKHEY